jgi:hypothetical protein
VVIFDDHTLLIRYKVNATRLAFPSSDRR